MGELTWQRPAQWHQWAAEHRAVREAVGLIDMSFMAKFRVQGRDARAVLDHLSANRLGLTGSITYTQWLTEDGMLDADVTVTALGERDFLVVATDTAHRHVHSRIEIGRAHV